MEPRDRETVVADIGRRIRELRRERNLTQEAFAEQLGRPTQNLQRLEQGGHMPSLRTLLHVAATLGVDVSLFFDVPVSREPTPIGRPRDTRED